MCISVVRRRWALNPAALRSVGWDSTKEKKQRLSDGKVKSTNNSLRIGRESRGSSKNISVQIWEIGILLLFVSHAAQAHICRTLEVKQDAVAQEERLQFHFLRNGFGRNPGLTLNLTPPPQLPFQIQIHAKMEEMCTDAKKILQILHKILHKTKSPSFP